MTRIRQAAGAAVAGSGIEGVVVSGLANEFVLYFTTPEEYDRQHYEGGNTHFGRMSSVLVQRELAKLAGNLARGEPAAAPFAFDPKNGVAPDGPAYPSGASAASALAQPAPRYGRLQRATFSWRGGTLGLDRPVDRAFVTAQRRKGRRWITAGQRPRAGDAVEGRRRRPLLGGVGDPPGRPARHLPAAWSPPSATGWPRATFRVSGTGALQVVPVPGRAGPGGGGAPVPGRQARRRPDPPPAVRARRRGALPGGQPHDPREAQERPLLLGEGARGRAGLGAARAERATASAT